MTHRRTEIRDAVLAALRTEPLLDNRVFVMRTRATQEDELPVVLVYALRESSALATLARALERTATFAIEIRASAVADIGAAVDALCEAVEDALADDPRFGGLALNSFLASTTIGLEGEAEKRQAVAVLEYTVIYRTKPAAS